MSDSLKTMMTPEQLLAEGYVPGTPKPRLVGTHRPPQRYDIDERACDEATCRACGHAGLEYAPYCRREDGSYRPFAQCPNCHAQTEL